MKAGDYVIATKYRDGHPGDHWCVGWYKETYLHCGYCPRHIVVDSNGNSFRANGFRRVQKITEAKGRWIVEHKNQIEKGNKSIWRLLKNFTLDGDQKLINKLMLEKD